MDEIQAFEKIAPYLSHPLALIGFVLLLLFSVHKTLIKSGTIPPVSPEVGGHLVQSLLRYGFVLALLIVLLGFGQQFYKTSISANPGDTNADLSFSVNYLYRNNKLSSFTPIEENSVLSSGDQYKVIFTPDQNGHVYVFQADSAGQIFQLFPMAQYGKHELNNLNPVQGGSIYYLPAQDKAFTLDRQTGVERIYFIGSKDRNVELERLYKELTQARNKKNQTEVKSSQTKINRVFKRRGLGGVVATEGTPISWRENGKVFSMIGRKLENLCNGCVDMIEFQHR